MISLFKKLFIDLFIFRFYTLKDTIKGIHVDHNIIADQILWLSISSQFGSLSSAIDSSLTRQYDTILHFLLENSLSLLLILLLTVHSNWSNNIKVPKYKKTPSSVSLGNPVYSGDMFNPSYFGYMSSVLVFLGSRIGVYSVCQSVFFPSKRINSFTSSVFSNLVVIVSLVKPGLS
eukprot:NODE_83_length_22684_cov_0.307934.p10 type:complete len:175 gc:universal NODE_83_length_22684_cov_0.307934:18534-18010(-)